MLELRYVDTAYIYELVKSNANAAEFLFLLSESQQNQSSETNRTCRMLGEFDCIYFAFSVFSPAWYQFWSLVGDGMNGCGWLKIFRGEKLNSGGH